MTCERFTPYLAGYAGSDLRPDTTRIVAAHLEGCTHCREEVVRHQAVVGGLRGMSAVTLRPPVGLAEEVIAAVRQHEHLGSVAAAMPLAVAERVRRVVADPRVREAAGQVGDASRRVAHRLTDPKNIAAAAAGTAAAAAGIAAIVSRRRRVARGTAPA